MMLLGPMMMGPPSAKMEALGCTTVPDMMVTSPWMLEVRHTNAPGSILSWLLASTPCFTCPALPAAAVPFKAVGVDVDVDDDDDDETVVVAIDDDLGTVSREPLVLPALLTAVALGAVLVEAAVWVGLAVPVPAAAAAASCC